MSEPTLYIVASPSGGGKSSLIAALLQRDDRVRLSVSHTTRPRRPGEEDGVHYHFVDDQAFLDLVEKGEFLEHARVFDNRYGTGRQAVERQLAAGNDVLLDIDWQGGRQVRAAFPAARGIFILPPSMEILRARLTRRGQDGEEIIERRMRDATAEISHWDEFEHVVVNDDFDAALEDMHAIIRTGNHARCGQEEKAREILAEFLGNG